MKLLTYFTVACCYIGLYSRSTAQNTHNPWTTASLQDVAAYSDRLIQPKNEQLVHLDEQMLQQVLAQAPEEFSPAASQPLLLAIPLPDGTVETFGIVHSPIVEDGLQKKYPNIHTYAGKGIDNPYASIRLDLTPTGFHGMILSPSGTVYIDPYARGTTAFYSSYYTQDYFSPHEEFICHADEMSDHISEESPSTEDRAFGDCQFRSYRLALAATGEYTAFHGGMAQAIAAQITAMNRVNGVLEREVAIRLIIIANNDLLIYTNAATDPYSNNNGGTMLGQNQTTIDNIIGTANYDIGHVFSTGGGGVAYQGSLCNPNAKAGGVTGLPNPIGDPFYIDFVAHEIGHQLGGSHSFNGTSGGCSGGNRNLPTAFEPGSGSTIIAYAGLCGSQNIQNNSDDYYHAITLQEMTDVITASTCGTLLASNNNEPVISHGPMSYVIPASTPFALESGATDPDGDALTYCWEQFDNENSAQPPVASAIGGPNFRSLDPTPSPIRYFPNLNAIVSGSNPTWEVLPSVSREMNFKVTVRDNQIGGCTSSEDASLTVNGGAGPFLVLNPNSSVTWFASSFETISWDVANTDQFPVNCQQVDIRLSYDGGFTYPLLLASQVPNTGSHTIQVPDTMNSTCRVKVEAADNIFFDISNQNFTIMEATSADYDINWPEASLVTCPDDTLFFPFQTASLLGFSHAISFMVGTPPQGISAMASPDTTVPGNMGQLMVIIDSSVSPGNYSLAVIAQADNGTQQAQTLEIEVVDAEELDALTVQTPMNGASWIGLNPTFSWLSLSNSTSYTFEIASTPNFGNTVVFSQAGIDNTTYTLASALSPGQFYYWRARGENACGPGPYSQIWGFQTGQCQEVVSTNVPVSIPAFSAPIVVNSTLISTISGTISDVNVVNLGGTHDAVSELSISLISPTGIEVVLFSGICSDSDQNFQLNFDDDASDSILCPPTMDQSYQPVDPLTVLNGQSASGFWTIRITDDANFNVGELQNWGLELCTDQADLPVLVRNSGLNTSQWFLDTISTSILQAASTSFGPSDLLFTIVDLPRSGDLRLNGVDLSVGGQFTQDDIDGDRFAYLHNGDTTEADSFRFAVQDANGAWIGVFTFPIEIKRGPVSIDDFASGLKVDVYPNPATDQMWIELEGEWTGDIDIRLSTIHGQVLHRQVSKKQGNHLLESISVQQWTSGIYLLQVRAEDGVRWEKVLIE